MAYLGLQYVPLSTSVTYSYGDTSLPNRRGIRIRHLSLGLLEVQWSYPAVGYTDTTYLYFYKNGVLVETKNLRVDACGPFGIYSGGTPVALVDDCVYYQRFRLSQGSRKARVHIYLERYSFTTGITTLLYSVEPWFSTNDVVGILSYGSLGVASGAIAYNRSDGYLYALFSACAEVWDADGDYNAYKAVVYCFSKAGALVRTTAFNFSESGGSGRWQAAFCPSLGTYGSEIYLAYRWYGNDPESFHFLWLKLLQFPTSGGGVTSVYSGGTESLPYAVGPYNLAIYPDDPLTLRCYASGSTSYYWDLSAYCDDMSQVAVIQRFGTNHFLVLAQKGGTMYLLELGSGSHTPIPRDSRALEDFSPVNGYAILGAEIPDADPDVPRSAAFPGGKKALTFQRPGWEVT